MWKSIVYKLYHLIILTNSVAFILTKIVNISHGFSSIEECASVTLGLADFISGMVKAFIIYNKRTQLIDIEKQFQKYQGDTKEETKVQADFDFMCRYDFIN